jgi:hypothetical protein
MHGRIRNSRPDHRIVIRYAPIIVPNSRAGDGPLQSKRRLSERLPIHQVNFRLAARKKQT